jgi:Bacterial pre-peptidase C-terminal domain
MPSGLFTAVTLHVVTCEDSFFMITNFLTKVTIASIGAIALIGTLASNGQAASIIQENNVSPGGDAGSTLLTATDLTASLVDRIDGQLDTSTDVDLYKIYIPGTGFSAATTGNPTGSINDSILRLLDFSGAVILLNDDVSATDTLSRVSSSAITAGAYFLEVSGKNMRNQGQTYKVKVDGAGTVPVPTPALLPGLLVLGAGAKRKRKQQAASAIA